MIKLVKRLVFFAALFLTALFVMFVINQTSQVVNLAASIAPLLGQVVLYFLLSIYATVIIIPLVSIFRRPITLMPPANPDSEAYRTYIRRLTRRLSRNPHLKDVVIDGKDLSTIEEALKKLDQQADGRIKAAASSVFIMTAISQYGALDAAIVILTQLRMIWQVTILYKQRPTLRELIYLYSNVLATAFLATRIENLDLLEDQLEPVIASLMGSTLSSLTPGVNTAATIIINSVIQGSANAFLTLRVGVITRQYCSSLIKPEKSQLRRAAAVQAAALLAKVLGESTYNVTRAVFRASAKAGKRPFRYGSDLVVKTSTKTWDAGKTTLRRGEKLAKKLGKAVKSGGKRIKLFFTAPGSPEEE